MYTLLSLILHRIAKLKNKGKKKNNDKKQKIVESRKSLSDVRYTCTLHVNNLLYVHVHVFNYFLCVCRVVQKNLVFVLGLSPRLADPEVRGERR